MNTQNYTGSTNKKIVDLFIKAIKKRLLNGEEVYLPHFGSLQVTIRTYPYLRMPKEFDPKKGFIYLNPIEWEKGELGVYWMRSNLIKGTKPTKVVVDKKFKKELEDAYKENMKFLDARQKTKGKINGVYNLFRKRIVG